MKRKQPNFASSVTMVRYLKAVLGLTLTHQVEAFLKLAFREAKHHGWPAACAYLKDLYTQAVALSLGLSPTPIPFRKSDKRGIDKNLRPFLSLIMSDDLNSKRGALTILRQSYLIFSEPSFDVTSITSEGEGKGVESIVRSFTTVASRWVPPMDPEGRIEIVPRACSGPNGPSSLLYSHLDAVALSQRPELLQALADLSSYIDSDSDGEPDDYTLGTWDPNNWPELVDLFKSAESDGAPAGGDSVPPDQPDKQSPVYWKRGLKHWVLRLAAWTKANFNIKGKRLPVSRLAFLSEGGCKTRVIAIGDLFTQAVLRPLHKKLMGRLRQLPQDCTFDQTKAVTFLKEATKKGPVYSFDLTSATDRFPIDLQEIVMAKAFGSLRLASLWRKCISDLRDFTVPGRRGRPSKEIFYKRGQGMGLYSSWPAFAYTHHVLIQWCADQEGIINFEDYRIIGDDVTIANREVAERYRMTLESLDIPISKAKSIVSLSPPFCGEIAKRLITEGHDISPIPPDLILQSRKYVTMLPALVDEIGRRYGIDHSTLASLPSLAENFRSRPQQAKALILLTAPLPFALWGGHPFYGASLNLQDNDSKELSSLDRTSSEYQALAELVAQTPWSKVDPEVVSNLGLVQKRIRTVFLMRQYEDTYRTWSIWDPTKATGSPSVVDKWSVGANSTVTVNAQHPFWKAYAWISNRLIGLFSKAQETILTVEDESLADADLRHCLDPSLKSYRGLRQRRSITASHLTLDVYKVLTGETTLPEIPKGDLHDEAERVRELYGL